MSQFQGKEMTQTDIHLKGTPLEDPWSQAETAFLCVPLFPFTLWSSVKSLNQGNQGITRQPKRRFFQLFSLY